DLDFDVPPTAAARRPALVHIGSISAVHGRAAAKVAELVAALTPEATVSYDPNVRPAIMPERAERRRRVEALVARADVGKVSDEDLAWFAPGEEVHQVLGSWLALGPALVVLARGSHGARAVTAGGQ